MCAKMSDVVSDLQLLLEESRVPEMTQTKALDIAMSGLVLSGIEVSSQSAFFGLLRHVTDFTYFSKEHLQTFDWFL